MDSSMDYIRRNWDGLCRQVHAISPDVTVVAVTKSATDEEVLALAHAGAADMAENRPQALLRRANQLAQAGFSPRMHEIGNLQTNKVKSILPICTLIHSVGSEKLAAVIDRCAAEAGRKMPVLMEVNSAAEEAKGGVLPAQAMDLFEKLRTFANLSVQGVMTMGPDLDDPDAYTPYFRLTRRIFEEAGERFGYDTDRPILSMGMSHSYLPAIREGATLIRVGRRLFEKEPNTF